MKNKKLLVGILAAAAVLLAVAAAVTVYLLQEKPKESSYDKIVIFQTDKESIQEISVVNKEDSYRFVRSEEGVLEPADTDITISSGKYDDLVVNICNMLADSEVKNPESDLSVYGFDAPASTLNVTLVDGTVRTFKVGIKTALQDQYFYQDVTGGKIYLISAYLGEVFTRKLADLRSEPLTVSNADYVERFELYTPGKKDIVASIDLNDPEATWQMEKPFNREVDTGTLRTKITEVLVGIRANDIAASQVDVKEYGLDEPNHTLVFKTKDDPSVTLRFGKTDANAVYFNIDGGNIVYRASKNVLSIFQVDPVDLTDRLGYLANIADVKQLTVSGQGKQYQIEINNDKKEFRVNGKTVEESTFRALYRTLMNFLITDSADSASAGETLYSMAVEKKDGTKDIVEVKLIQDRTCLLVINGNGDFTISRSDIDSMLTELGKIES